MTLPAPLMVITDRRMAAWPLPKLADRLFAAGCRWLLVREKDLPVAELEALVRTIVALGRPYGAVVAVSGQAAVAARCGAGAVHLPRGESIDRARATVGADVLIGQSTHSGDEAEAAVEAGADYVTISPIFPTASKPGYGPVLGVERLAKLAARLPIPVVALGGITDRNAGDCIRAGAAAVAVMGSVMRAEDPEAIVQQLRRSVTAGKRKS